jgi:hypothetical protein
MVETVVPGVFHRRDHGAGVVVLTGGDQCGRQAFGVIVDGEPEQHQLHQRHTQHHRKGDAVAAHLNGFLGDDGQ